MLDGRLLVDAHVHVPVLGTLKPAWMDWADEFGPDGIIERIWDRDGRPRPAALEELFAAEGVDAALLFCEYSPKATGYQRFEDLLPLRLPEPAAGPASQPVLRPLTEDSGFIGDPKTKTTWKVGAVATPVYPTAWLPTLRLANAWRAMLTEQPFAE